jgi:hypothetical protein
MIHASGMTMMFVSTSSSSSESCFEVQVNNKPELPSRPDVYIINIVNAFSISIENWFPNMFSVLNTIMLDTVADPSPIWMIFYILSSPARFYASSISIRKFISFES